MSATAVETTRLVVTPADSVNEISGCQSFSAKFATIILGSVIAGFIGLGVGAILRNTGLADREILPVGLILGAFWGSLISIAYVMSKNHRQSDGLLEQRV